MMDKTTQKGFREREWIKKEVSYKPVSQTGRVGTSPLSGGWGLKGDRAMLAVGFLPLINVLMKFNLSNAGPRLSCKDCGTAWSEGVGGGAGDGRQNSGENKELRILCDTESSYIFSYRLRHRPEFGFQNIIPVPALLTLRDLGV
jgi:hypothetical protein